MPSAVERFSVERFRDLTVAEIQERVRQFLEMTAFQLPLEESVDV